MPACIPALPFFLMAGKDFSSMASVPGIDQVPETTLEVNWLISVLST